MTVIVVLSALAIVIGLAALSAAARDFRKAATLRRSTAVVVYAAWTSHAGAFVAATFLDPYRLHRWATLAAIAGVALGIAGGFLYVAALARFRSLGQVSGTEVGGMVMGGVYALSRNPQYTGWMLFLLGVAVAVRSPIAVGLVAVAAAAVRYWVPHEERHLLDEFGEPYEQYRQRVPRFLGVIRD